MIRHVRWGGSMVVLAMTAVPLLAQPEAPAPSKPSWFAGLFQSEEAKPGSFAEEQAAKQRVRYGPLDPEVREQALIAEQEAYQRRMDVCLKLRQIAEQENNDTLFQKANDLQEAASQVYQLRISRLGIATAPENADELPSTAMPAPILPTETTSISQRPSTPSPIAVPKRDFHEVKP